MSVPLYMDQHVRRAVTRGLRRYGIDVLTTQEDGTETLDDELLLERATTLGRVLVSSDKDFLFITARWQQQGRAFMGLVHVTRRAVALRGLIDDLHLIAVVNEPHEIANQVIYLPL